mmetsp:Transcript_27361/g.58773  ORF Transcript_27361/g.58773 Transcript_27361/m.58773 type:complete len:430 (+) Transcript_27361:1081-2370(+)
MRPPPVTLPALEVSVGSGCAAFLRLELVGVHGEAHAAPRLAPVESRVHEDFVESLQLGLAFDQSGPRDDHGVHSLRDLTSDGHGGDLANVLDATVGAAPDEDLLDRRALDGRAPLQADVLQRTCDGRLTRLVVALLIDLGNGARDRHGVLGRRAPRDRGRDVLCVDDHRGVVHRSVVGGEGPPVLDGLVPILPLGTHGTSLEVFEGGVVGGDDSRAGSGLDGHVGDGHTGLHGEFFDGLSGEFDGSAGSARRADDSADVEDDVLGGYAGFEGAVDADEHVNGFGLGKGLSRQHMLHLARTNPKRQRPKRPMSRRMTVPANRRTPRQRETLLRSDNMHDPLPLVLHAEIPETEVLHVRLHLHHLGATGRLFDECRNVQQGGAIGRGDVVIDRGEGAVRATDVAVGETQALEGLGGGHLVNEMTIDVEEEG